MQLYDWQREALEAWRTQRSRGVVEAVTGTGKTMVGLAAAAEALQCNGKVQIVVPTIELLHQWTRAVRRHMPNTLVGQLGDGADAGLITSDVLVSVVNSARCYKASRLPKSSLLVADECHRYGSGVNATALNEGFERRLGLSATYARSDEGNANYLDPYFGDTCFRVGYARAIADDITAHFKVALVAVRFSVAEQRAYADAARSASDALRWLVQRRLVRDKPFGETMKDISGLARQGRCGQATSKARIFLQNFAEKRRLLAETPAKREALRELAPAIAVADRSIVFTQTVDAAEYAASVLGASGIVAEALHSELDGEDRRTILSQFLKGALKAIAAPQVLDEGIDVPAADLAIILAASSTRRQMIQRMGRVLRKKADGRLARFVIFYVVGTSEDPGQGAHEDFLEEVTSVANDVRSFGDSPSSGPDPIRWTG